MICLAISTEYRRVTDRRTDRRTDILPRHSPRYAYASRSKNQWRRRGVCCAVPQVSSLVVLCSSSNFVFTSDKADVSSHRVVLYRVQEALDMRHVGDRESFHLAHTVIETIVTLLIIILRMINTKMGYIEVQVTVQRLQHFDPVHEPHLRAVWTWMWLLLAAGLLTFVACIVCFVVFDQLAHLGWTILSNQACIITMRLLDGFYESRIHAAVKKIKEDQHKARMANVHRERKKGAVLFSSQFLGPYKCYQFK